MEQGELYRMDSGGEPIDIIVPTHGRLEDLTIPCVQALYAHTKSLFHLIVVDDTTPEMEGGAPLTAQWFERLQIEQNNVTFIHSDVPFKSGNQIFNIGLAHGNNRFIATVMNSVTVEPDWDVVPIRMMAGNPKIGVTGIKCLKTGWGPELEGKIESAGIVMTGYTPCDMGSGEHGHRLPISYPCFSLQWAFALLRREAVVGNLDEDLWQGFVGFDDIDNTLVVRHRGWEAWYCGLGAGFHNTHATRGSPKNEILLKNRKNAEIFYKRWGYWDLFKSYNPYAHEYYPNGVEFIANANEMPLKVEFKPKEDNVEVSRLYQGRARIKECLDITEGILPREEIVLAELASRAAKKDAILVEVGSWKGHSASLIGGEAKVLGGHLYCIDHWKGNEGTNNTALATNKNIYDIFENNLKEFGLWNYITPMIMDSVTASKEFTDGSIDFLFLDGDHRYEQFSEDLKVWLPRMKVGGIICGHDCEGYYSKYSKKKQKEINARLGEDYSLEDLRHSGVIKALFEYFGDDYVIPPNTRIWYKEIVEV